MRKKNPTLFYHRQARPTDPCKLREASGLYFCGTRLWESLSNPERIVLADLWIGNNVSFLLRLGPDYFLLTGIGCVCIFNWKEYGRREQWRCWNQTWVLTRSRCELVVFTQPEPSFKQLQRGVMKMARCPHACCASMTTWFGSIAPT